jgi:hypothetical protein
LHLPPHIFISRSDLPKVKFKSSLAVRLPGEEERVVISVD